jgi:hypothetical protein
MENTIKGLGDDQQKQLLFLMLVQQHDQIAGMGLGKLPNPATNKVEKDLNSAKYAIDTLLMLQQYTKGNISAEMNDFLDQTLTRLKLDYAKAVSESKKKPDNQSQPSSGSTPGNGGDAGTTESPSATADAGHKDPDADSESDTGKKN